ncbi:MAG: hypothetical protein ACP5N3_02265 [Candidatus Nanoarchaeia archaeon]
MEELVKQDSKSLVGAMSKLRDMEMRLVNDIHQIYSSHIILFAKELTLDDVISFMDLDAFSKKLADDLKLDVEKLKIMSVYNLEESHIYGGLLNVTLSKKQLNLRYRYTVINEFYGHQISSLYDEITLKTEEAIIQGQEDLPF